MAHKLLPDDIIEGKKKTKVFHLPNLGGKFGLAFYIGKKEIFIGVGVNDIEIEQVIRRRTIKAPKSRVKVFQFD